MKGTEALDLANKITKALYPELYGNPSNNMQQIALVMGARGIIADVLTKEPLVRQTEPTT